MRKKPTKTQVKEDLLQKLDSKGMVDKFYVDLVEDYMVLWDIKSALARECKQRKMIPWKNGENQQGEKVNPAMKEFRDTNKRMTELLKSLGLEAPSKDDDNDDFEDI